MSQKLMNACQKGDLNKVRSLLISQSNPSNIHDRNSKGGNALIKACYYGHLDIVQYLLTSNDLKEHANIHDKDKDDCNGLMYACMGGYLEIVDYLLTSTELKENAHLYDKSNNGWNAFMFSCYYDHWDIAQYLIIEQNMKVDDETMDLLIENEHKNVLEMLKSRDLYHKLNNNLSKNNQVTPKMKV